MARLEGQRTAGWYQLWRVPSYGPEMPHPPFVPDLRRTDEPWTAEITSRRAGYRIRYRKGPMQEQGAAWRPSRKAAERKARRGIARRNAASRRLGASWEVHGMETVLDVPPVPVPYPVDAAHPPIDFDG
jgi:hypothetical protein